MPRDIKHGDSTADAEDVATSASKRKSRKPSQHIGKRQATNIIAALKFAEAIGFPLNVSVDTSWIFFSGNTDDRTRFTGLQQRLSKWAGRRGFPLTMIWTREVGQYGSPHTHVLLHVPPIFIHDGTFQRALESSLEPEGGPIHDKAILFQKAYSPGKASLQSQRNRPQARQRLRHPARIPRDSCWKAGRLHPEPRTRS